MYPSKSELSFWIISKTFDKVWHDGLILKLRQNEVNGRVLVPSPSI